MKFYKYRHNFASKWTPWDYAVSELDAEELKSRVSSAVSGIEDYEATEVEETDNPPAMWIKRNIDGVKKQIKSLQAVQKLYESKL